MSECARPQSPARSGWVHPPPEVALKEDRGPMPDETHEPTAGGVRSRWGTLALIGPGIAIAATGVGAGDMVAAAASGAKYGYALVWAALVGAVLKYVLNEGLARWQLATGTTLLEGWVQRLGKWVRIYFFAYLVVWSFVIGGALASACGLAAHAIAPALPLEAWGVIHAVVAAALVAFGRYDQFERLMKVFIGVMFVALIGCALCVASPLTSASRCVTSVAIPPAPSMIKAIG